MLCVHGSRLSTVSPYPPTVNGCAAVQRFTVGGYGEAVHLSVCAAAANARHKTVVVLYIKLAMLSLL